MQYKYYYNNVPGQGLQRNNLIYTSMISEDEKTFLQWYVNDTEYHQGENEIVDPKLMDEKFLREIKWLTHMRDNYPEHVPCITKIDLKNKKIYLEIEGPDFWNRANCSIENYDKVLPNWQEQMLEIIRSHESLGLYKYSMHPSSYFIVNGKLKSINYFFCYHKSEGPISIANHSSHIHSNRQKIMKKQIETMGLSWDKPESLNLLQHLCFESFRTNYPDDFINLAKGIYS